MKKQVLFVLTFILAGQWSGVPAGMNVNPENLKGPGEVETQEHVKAENLEECPICCNKLDNPVALPCEKPHFICVGCLSKLKKATASHANVPCPICRKEYSHKNVAFLLNDHTILQRHCFDLLRNAMSKGAIDEVKKIFEQGFYVNFKDPQMGTTPLILAVLNAYKGDNALQILKIILKKGALIAEPLQANCSNWCIRAREKKAAIMILDHFKDSHDADAVKKFLNNSLVQAQDTETIDVLINLGAEKDILVASRMAEIYKKINTQTNKYRDFDGRVRPGRLDIIIPSKEEIEKYVQQYYPDFKYTE